MKKLFLLCLSLVAALGAVADVTVCDVTPDANGHFDCPYIRSGSITWNESGRTLTLNNAVVEYSSESPYDYVNPIRVTEDATIIIHGECKLTTTGFVAIGLEGSNSKNVIIQGNGSLYLSSTMRGIYLKCARLTVRDITLQTTKGIMNNGDGVLCSLLFSNVQADINGVIERIGETIVFQNCAITYPEDAYIEHEEYGYYVAYGNGSRANHIIISRGDDGLKGDVNGDGEVNIADVNAVISTILRGDNSMASDVNGDTEVNIADVNAVISIILNPSSEQPDHEWVDLGLHSGTLWAKCNIGANSPEEYGDYFAWGETNPKETYTWGNYKWCNGDLFSMTKYCRESENGYEGFTDGKGELDPEDDAAHANWGSTWRMPTIEQEQELVNECTWEWTTVNGVSGRLFTGPNGNTMFLPAAGVRFGTTLNGAETVARYLSRSLHDEFSFHAFHLYFDSGSIHKGYDYRYNGCTVRPVRVP